MSQPVTVTDAPGGEIVRHGSQVVTFSLAGALIAEEIAWRKGFKSADFQDYVNDNTTGNPGKVNESAYSSTKATGSMVIQIKAAATAIFPGEFVTFAHQGFSSLKFIVTEVGIALTQNGATKLPIQIAEWMVDSPIPRIIALDGDFSIAKPCGPILFSRPFLNAGNSVLQYKQKFRQFRPFWGAADANSNGVNSNFKLIGESELEDTGVANVVTWDRIYSTVPPNFSEKGSAVKTIKYLITSYHGTPSSPGSLIAATVRTQTKTVPVDIFWNFYLGSPNVGLPDVSDVSVETIVIPSQPPDGTVLWILATGGFTWTVVDGGNNAGYRFLQGEIGRWAGNIYYKKEMWG